MWGMKQNLTGPVASCEIVLGRMEFLYAHHISAERDGFRPARLRRRSLQHNPGEHMDWSSYYMKVIKPLS